MRAFLELGPLSRSLICFWAIALMFSFVMNAVFSVRRKQYLSAASAGAAIAVLYFVMQICRNVSKAHLGSELHPLAESVGALPWIAYVLLLAGLTVGYIVHLRMSTIYANTHITPTAIKEAMDKNPTGICYFRDNGQVILTNHKMNLLSFAVMGRALLNGQAAGDYYRRVYCDCEAGFSLREGIRIRPLHRGYCCALEPDAGAE